MAKLGSLDLRVPKLREGSYSPGFLKLRWIPEKVPLAVIYGSPSMDVLETLGRYTGVLSDSY